MPGLPQTGQAPRFLDGEAVDMPQHMASGRSGRKARSPQCRSDCGPSAASVGRSPMRSASHQISYCEDRTSFRRRAASILLALVINALVALMLLTIAAQRRFGSPDERGTILVRLLPQASDAPTPSR
ncbi:MAG TPA: hypothetical protein VJM09_08985, partial [Sphingobium sp.]|nr:hypothetical protein [Sphingobium sp.]